MYVYMYTHICTYIPAAPPAAGLPLPATVPRLFAALPEACMDDVAQVIHFLYVCMHM